MDKKFNKTLIMFLSARGEDYSQVAAFESGADDYVTKPIKPRILNSKVKALLRRFRNDFSQTLSYQNIVIDSEKYTVEVDGKTINLPRKEFELLFLLAGRPGKVFKREKIMEFYERVSGARMHAAFYRPNEVNMQAISVFLLEDIAEFSRNCFTTLNEMHNVLTFNKI
jgi:DNA-binding response OmpR family regulator